MTNKLSPLLKAAKKLCLAAKTTYGSEGLNLTELLLAINQYECAIKEYEESIEAEVQQFNKYFCN